MPAIQRKINCNWCGKPFFGRLDAKWCQEKCRSAARAEDAKFIIPQIPRSGVVGVTFSRIRQHWNVSIPDPPPRVNGKRKYVGSFKDLKEAIDFQREIMGNDLHSGVSGAHKGL